MPSPFWARHADRRPFLVGRARIVAALRRFFAERGFVEVETSVLVPSPGNETHLHAFATEWVTPAAARHTIYLRTSPELACKKLLAAGEPRIVDFARSFRNRERGALHHPEFTMLEWYRAREPYEVLMEDCAAILACTARAVGAERLSFHDRTVDPFAPPERLAVADAFARYADIDLPAVLPPAPAARFAAAAAAAGVRTGADDGWGDIFSRVLAEEVPVAFVYDGTTHAVMMASRPTSATSRSASASPRAGSLGRRTSPSSRSSRTPPGSRRGCGWRPTPRAGSPSAGAPRSARPAAASAAWTASRPRCPRSRTSAAGRR